MATRWIKRLAWLVLLLVVSILPAQLARGGGLRRDDAGAGDAGGMVVRWIIGGVAGSGIVVAILFARRHRRLSR